MDNILKGKTILVIGGSGRLGDVLINEILKQNGRVIITSRSKSKVAAFNNKIMSSGKRGEAFELSLENKDEMVDFVKDLVDRKMFIDGLVHNAFASLAFKPVGMIPLSYWYDSIRVSVAACEIIASALVNARESIGIKSIVNISSIYADRAPNFRMYEKNQNPNPIYYGPIKASVLAITRYLAALWGKFDIRVNSISPGGILISQSGEFVKNYNATVPQNRMVTAKEVSDAIIFLLSDQSKGITGTNLTVDAGKTIW